MTVSLNFTKGNKITSSSVTGIGLGSADHNNKGSEHMTLGTNQLIGVRTVACGQSTLTSGAVTITLPAPLPKVFSGSVNGLTNYIIVTNSISSTNYTRPVSGGNNATTGTFDHFTIQGNGSDVVNWMIADAGI